MDVSVTKYIAYINCQTRTLIYELEIGIEGYHI